MLEGTLSPILTQQSCTHTPAAMFSWQAGFTFLQHCPGSTGRAQGRHQELLWVCSARAKHTEPWKMGASSPLTTNFGKDPVLGSSPRTPWELPQADTALFSLPGPGNRASSAPAPALALPQVQTPGPPSEVWPSSTRQSRLGGRMGDDHHHPEQSPGSSRPCSATT